MVVTIDKGIMLQHEMRDKLGHNHFANEQYPTNEEGQPHGFVPASQDRHIQMAESIRDFEALICKGMGRGAYESMLTLNIRPLVTDINDVDEAAIAFSNGQMVDYIEKLH